MQLETLLPNQDKIKTENLDAQIKKWAKAIRNEEPLIIEENQKQNWQDFCEKVCQFAITWGEDASGETTGKKPYFYNLFQLKKNLSIAEHQLCSVLKKLNYNWDWCDLKIKQAGVREDYSEEVIKQAESIISKNNEQSFLAEQTTDQQTHLDAYSIDSSRTKDFDDAISVEKINNVYFIRLHISDVASFIPFTENSPLLEHLQTHISSFYTPAKTYHLLPPILAESFFSLLENEKKSVFTFEWQLDEDASIQNYKIYRSSICVKKNLSYKTASEMITSNKEWNFLYLFCEKLLQKRKQQGALILNHKTVNVASQNEKKIVIEPVDLDSPAQRIVSELAIAANSLFGDLAAQNLLQVIYRCQNPYRVIYPNDPLQIRDVQISKAYFSLTNKRHAGLGVKNYIQVTSPIRRFSDLLNQLALLYWLEKKQPVVTQKLNKKYFSFIKDKITQKTDCFKKLEKNILNYYKLKYLVQNLNLPFKIKLIKQLKNSSLIHFVDLDFALRLGDGSLPLPLESGHLYQIKIKSVDLPTQNLQIESFWKAD